MVIAVIHLLVTGFEAFPGVPSNPTARLIERLPARIAGAELTRAILPVDTQRIAGALSALVPARFDAVVHTGVAHTRARISLERRAVNRLDFSVPDNAGRRPEGIPIDPDGPAERSTRLPLEALATAFAGVGLEVETSDDAGRYLCNQLMYLGLTQTSAPSGFVHVPPDETLAAELPPGAAFVPFDQLLAGFEAALSSLVGQLTAEVRA